MNETFQKTSEQAAAFQKMWTETFTKTMLAALTTGGDSPPPEMLRQMRAGIFQALSESWDQFLRSPQFLESMKQWMDTAVSFRRITNDFMARVHSETQSPSRDDINTVMLTVRHIEKRLLDRLDELAAKLDTLSRATSGPTTVRASADTPAEGKPQRRSRSRRRVPARKAKP